MRRKSLARVGAALLTLALLSGCGDPHASTNYSITRVVDALTGVPGNANVDVALSNNFPAAMNLPQGGFTPFATGGLGPTTVTVRQAGTQTVLIPSTSVWVPTGKTGLIAVTGVYGTTGATAPKAMYIPEASTPVAADFATSTGAGLIQIGIRLVNLSPDSQSVSVSGSIGLSNVSYGSATDYMIMSIPADKLTPTSTTFLSTGTLQLRIVDASTGVTIPLSSGSNASAAGVVNGGTYSVFLYGLRNPGAGQQAFTGTVTPQPDVK